MTARPRSATGVCLLVALLLLVWTTGAAADPRPISILVLGDSLTAGFGLDPAQAYPALLENKLRRAGYDVKVINAGVSGDTTADGLARLDWVLQERPDAVILALGANDALRGLSPQDAEANLDAILSRLSELKLPVILAGMLAPANMGKPYKDAFDAVYTHLAEKYDNVTLLPFLLAGVAGEPSLNQRDGIHPNPRGASAIADNLYPQVSALLDDLAKAN